MNPPVRTADEAMGLIRARGRVYVASGLGHPDTLARPLLSRGAAAGPLTIVTSLLGTLPPYCDSSVSDRCRVLSFRGTLAARAAIASGQTEVVPAHLSTVPRLLRGALRPDVALIQVTLPDRHGRYSLGASVLYQRSAISAADLVIAEVNPELPWAGGDAVLDGTDIDVLVHGSHPLPEPRPAVPTHAELQVASHVLDLVPDGAVVQVGMGGVGDAVMGGLARRNDLKLHTGLVSDSLLGLLDSPALTSGEAAVVCGAALGSKRLYERIGRDPRVSIRGVEHTHNAHVMAALGSFIAVNSAVEIDLDGQVNAETVDGLPVSGTGGQGDFFRGAALAARGLGIIAMTACTRSGRPRIVERLQAPGTVSTPRTDVEVVVTEYGMADLRGLGGPSRARALRAIAGPLATPTTAEGRR